MRKLAVIKLGGSLITDKSRPLTLKREVLEEVAGTLEELSREWQLVLVHGGGSFGHFAVAQAGGSLRKLLSDVTHWMSALNLEVTSSLRARGLAAVGLPPITIARMEGRSCVVSTAVLRELLAAGTVPVSHGGVVTGDAGFEILSGDTLASEVALQLRAGALVFVMDVDCVYMSDPRANPSARPVKVLTREAVKLVTGGSSGIDVTGGIQLKLREALRAAEGGVRVSLGGLRKLRAMVEGSEGSYTVVRATPSHS